MTSPPPVPARARTVPFRVALRAWTLIGLQSFGGPAGQIAVMHRILVDERRWLSESRFLHALNYCMLLPGPEAMQLVTYTGWLLHRTLGGVVAGVLFVLPGFLAILALSLLYVGFHDVALVQGAFDGLKPAVLAVVVQAALKIGGRVLKTWSMRAIAAGAFLALFAFAVPFPYIILAAACAGLVGARLAPGQFLVVRQREAAPGLPDDSLLGDHVPDHARPSLRATIVTISTWLALWLVPVAALHAVLGRDHVFAQLARFFSVAAVVTFGGAYSVLAYVAQQAVEVHAWLKPGEMLDGLAMAETTPGPLIQVVQFVGFMGAFRDPGSLNPYAAAVLASILVTWVTFVPCFLWIFAGAPYIESLRGRPALTGALSAITAAVAGVIANLAAWFAAHTLFREVGTFDSTVLRAPVPVLASVNVPAVIIAVGAALLLLRFKVGMLPTLALAGVAGIVAAMLRTA